MEPDIQVQLDMIFERLTILEDRVFEDMDDNYEVAADDMPPAEDKTLEQVVAEFEEQKLKDFELPKSEE